MHLTIVAHGDKTIFTYTQQFASGVFRYLTERFHGFIPFLVGKEDFYTFQLGQHSAVGAIDLDVIGQFKAAAGRRRDNLGHGRPPTVGHKCHKGQED